MTPATEKLGLRTLEDISTLILQSHDLLETLNNIATLVAQRMGTEVCTIYLLEDDGVTLRLRASEGLAPEAVGRISMKLGEGLIGLAAEERRVVSIQEPQNHPRFKYFAETGEEQYHSFLCIPLYDRREPIGVIAIQTLDPREFSAAEISALSTIAFQISSIVVNARLLDSIRQRDPGLAAMIEDPTVENNHHDSSPVVLRGKVAYPGVVMGAAQVMDERLGFADILDEKNVDLLQQSKNLDEALEKTRIQTLYLERRVAEKLSEDDASIFHTHLMILEDRSFLDKLHRMIDTGHTAAYALKRVVGDYLEAFRHMDDPYLRERAADMDDIGRRILSNLVGQGEQTLHLKHPGILVAKEILPSDMAMLDHEQILGIVTESGERNSHAVIMAKSLGIPALVDIKGVVKAVDTDDNVVIDANSGAFYIRPSTPICEEYERLVADIDRDHDRLAALHDKPALTRDGVRLTLRANIGLLSDINIARRHAAEGVGLYRTEFPYMARGRFPDREDQYQLYQQVVEGFAGHPVTIRTLDIGGDKALPYFAPPKEDNPFLGWRSVRVSLDTPDIFNTQIEAILLASRHGRVKLLFPMISTMEEVLTCRSMVDKARESLRKEGFDIPDQVEIGIMVEVPATVLIAEELAAQVDFFALGTNDLVQYLLAADRNNPLVNRYYDSLHPAIIRVISSMVKLTNRTGTGLCICGEMATDRLNLLALIGLGVREFSMPAPFIPGTKEFVSAVSVAEASIVADKILRCSDSGSIRNHLLTALNKLDLA
ncbi:MAG: phosphoenolpyruvate--protein phosphotransferase [Desulfuromonas sp.]|nr:MAG: phosphoenolpyruvate--protein phosphotransferase [Desulfuromonas sp.]